MKKRVPSFVAGLLCGMTLLGGVPALAAAGLSVQPSTQNCFVDGEPVQLEAYNISGYNYIKLGDLSPLVGFGLKYDRTTNSVYIGELPENETPIDIPNSDQKLTLKEGDVVRCDDGSTYTITDMSRYDSNVFASGPVGELPTATCDWSKFPDVDLPDAEVRHFTSGGRDTLFIRNLYETRRMQYTIYNALGKEPTAWAGNTPLATVQLTVPAELEAYTHSFWPWRSSELEELVQSRPNSRYYAEAWDYYLDGVFQYTRYCVVSL